jgi:hypothetical protein
MVDGSNEESFVELRDAAKVIAEALSRLGRNFDPASHDDLDRVVQYVSDLMADDRAMYDELVSALIRTEDLLPKKRGPVFCEALATRKAEAREAL